MAARKRRGTSHEGWDDSVRERIRTSMLVNRLVDHVLGTVELSSTQVQAGLGLMKKILPDLASVEHSGEVATFVAAVPEVVKDVDEWSTRYSKQPLQ